MDVYMTVGPLVSDRVKGGCLQDSNSWFAG